MSKLPISIFIITKNEGDRIENIILKAKKITGDIIIIDSGSDDNTVQLAESLDVEVIFNKWQGYGQQKIFGESKCKNKWILNIDADEEITNELADEIKKIFHSNEYKDFAGFRIKIVNKFFCEKKPKKLAYYYNQLRLYNVDKAGFKNSSIHDSVIIKDNYKGKIGQLHNIIEHKSFKSVAHWVDKINFYSNLQAEDNFNKNKCPSHIKIFLTIIISFFKAYFIRRYFIYGFSGVYYSA
ncbi:glycosyltransferase family 2 protein, partial [Rickettsiales bacterium]|nr:glycosyltransferase family 2 protein [Rickettsiales bacterium]